MGSGCRSRLNMSQRSTKEKNFRLWEKWWDQGQYQNDAWQVESLRYFPKSWNQW